MVKFADLNQRKTLFLTSGEQCLAQGVSAALQHLSILLFCHIFHLYQVTALSPTLVLIVLLRATVRLQCLVSGRHTTYLKRGRCRIHFDL